MAITVLSEEHPDTSGGFSQPHSSRMKITAIIILFIISLISFVCQTEFTSQAYILGYSEPFFLLFITHGLWWIFWPIQVFAVSLWKTVRRLSEENKPKEERDLRVREELLPNYESPEDSRPQGAKKPFSACKYFKLCVIKQIHNIYHTSILVYEANVNDNFSSKCNETIQNSTQLSQTRSLTDCVRSFLKTPSFRYLVSRCFFVALVLTVAGATWYAAMAMTYASDVTAIYNCSAFTAYTFAIPILRERFSWLKAGSVLVALSGVFIVAYSDDGTVADSETKTYPYRFWGNFIILIGAVLYGYYEVLYKKYACVPLELSFILTPRRQVIFSNFIMAILGVFSVLILGSGILITQLLGIHHFNLINYGSNTAKIWLYNLGSVISNLLFSALFLCLMALTSPVLSSVSSLLTIFLIGVVEWILFDNKLGFQQLVGDSLVIVGFILLSAASWKEISEGSDEDDVEAISTYSYAVSSMGQESIRSRNP